MSDGKNTAGKKPVLDDRLNIVMLVAVLVAIGAYLINQIYDLDVWWHVVIGNDILTRFAVPNHDRFALAALGRPYHDSHWLFQVVLAVAHRLGGMSGVEAVMVSIWAVALFFCGKAIRRWSGPQLSYILLFLAAMASVERFLPRPEIVTFLMITLFYLRLQEGKYRSLPDLAVLGLLQVVWANCHGLFVLGPFMVACYWIVAVIRHFRKMDSDTAALGRLLGILLVATLLTPFGFQGWEYALLLSTEVSPSSELSLNAVGELSPTFGAAAMSAPAFWFFACLLAATVLTGIQAAMRGKLSPERLLLAAGMCVAALTGRRNMVLFALVAAPFIAENLQPLMAGKVRGMRPFAVAAALAMLAWASFPLTGRYYLMMEIPSRFGWGTTPSFFPYGLPTFMERIGFKGQIFNSNTLGGFYLYHAYPKQIPLTDGRWEVYGGRVLESIRKAPRDPLLWKHLVNEYDIRGILLQHASPEARSLLPLLPADPRWQLVYYDHAASFWMRSDTPALPPGIDLSAGGSLPPQPSRIDDILILDIFLQKVGAEELQLRNLERAVTFGFRTEQMLERIGKAQVKLNKSTEAEETFRRLNRKYPKNVKALNELAFFAYRRGDMKTAESLLRHALDIAPDDNQIKENYRRIQGQLRQSPLGFPTGK